MKRGRSLPGEQIGLDYFRTTDEALTNKNLWAKNREEMIAAFRSSTLVLGQDVELDDGYINDYEHLIGRKYNSRTGSAGGLYLVWPAEVEDPAQESLVTEEVLKQMYKERMKATEEGLPISPPYHVYARFNIDQAPTVKFTQLTVQNLYSLDEDRG